MTFLDVLPSLSERRFQRQVFDLAELLGWRVWHDSATNQRQTCRRCGSPLACAHCGEPIPIVRNRAGLLDLLLVRRPRVIFAELKAERGKLTPEQLATLGELRDCSVESYVWRPSDWSKIERILR